jgi:hypothetical protein
MTEECNTDTHRESSAHWKGRLRHLALVVLKVASWLYSAYRAASKAYDFVRSIIAVVRDWLD